MIKMDWCFGDRAIIKEGWDGAGKELEILGSAVFHEQWWVPVVITKEDDPTLFKVTGLDWKRGKQNITSGSGSSKEEKVPGVDDPSGEVISESLLSSVDKMGQESNVPHTNLVGKEYSPLIIRRYSLPILSFIALITDDDLNSLDDVVNGFFALTKLPNTIQGMRNVAGQLSEVLMKEYPKTEGVAVILQADKMTISSLAGDFMNATPCRIELYSLLNFATQV